MDNTKNSILPKHWQVKRLEELLTYFIGGDWGKDENFPDDSYDLAFCIRGSEIKNWEVEKGLTASLRKVRKSSIETRKLKEGDILVEISGGGPEQPVGRTVLIDKSVLNYQPHIPKICTNFLRLIRPVNEIDPKFLNLYLKLFYYSGEIVKYQGGSNNLRNLKFPDFIKIQIPVPPFAEQQAIVSKIEELISELENGKQQLLTAQEQIKVYRQSLLKLAFEGKLTNKNVKEGELPKGWKLTEFGTVIDKIEAGKSFKCNERTPNIDEVGVLKVSAVTWQVFNEIESKTVIEKHRINKDYLVKSGDFLFSRANTLDLIGAVVLVNFIERKLMLSDKTLRFIFKGDILKPYILYYLRSRKGRKEIQRLSTGNQESMRNIGQQKIKQIEFPLCSIEEQKKVINELESKLSVCDKIEETISQSLQQAETLRQSILKKAFEGKLGLGKAVALEPEQFIDDDVSWQLALVVRQIERELKINYGEVALQKTVFNCNLLNPGFVNNYQFINSNFGTYSFELRDDLKDNPYLEKIRIKGKEVFVVKDSYKSKTDSILLKQKNGDFVKSLNQILTLYKSTFINKETDKIELLNTVFKSVIDTHSFQLSDVRQAMKDWKTPKATFKNKAEKFTEAETKKCLEFVKEKGWDLKLIK